MEEYWKALIKGLTPESQRDLDWYWKIPLGITILLGILWLI